MLVCEKCGSEFKNLSGLLSHSKRKIPCDIYNSKCLNPECSNEVKYPNKFCCQTCAGKVNSPGRKHSEETKRKISISNGGNGTNLPSKKPCLNCGKPVLRKFCNSKCQHSYKSKILIQTTKFEFLPKGLIKKIFKKEKGNKCESCGFEYIDEKGNGPFDIHHKDGNRNNWKKENLELLCLNCHWQTNNYGFKNRKHKEESRKKMSKN
jgi:hypothetical protein